MNAFDELKLKVYESTLSSEMIEEMIDLMESCDEEDVQEVCESVEAFVTEANAYNKLANKYKDEYNKNMMKAKTYHDASMVETNEPETKALTRAYQARIDADSNGLGDIRKYSKRGIGTKLNPNNIRHTDKCKDAREKKHDWMMDHGNIGKSPEEMYKSGRYLNAQKELNKIDKKYKR